METIKPSYFSSKYPWGCVFKQAEYEIVALNIMHILKRTGDEFRELSFEEYKIERIKDGNFSEREQVYFNEVLPYCKSPDTACLFSKCWSIN